LILFGANAAGFEQGLCGPWVHHGRAPDARQVALRYQIGGKRSMVQPAGRNTAMHSGNRFDTRAALYGCTRRAYLNVDGW
jgi:hypothetical protein